MTTISGPGQFVPNTLQTIDPNSNVQTTTSTSSTTPTVLPPISSYLSLPFARLTLATIGLDLPRTPEDVAAILAEVSSILDRTIDENRNLRALAVAAGFRSALTGLGGVIGTMAALQDSYATMKIEREAKIVQRDQKTYELGQKVQQSNNLQTQINSANGTINSLSNQVNSLNQQIAVAVQTGNAPLAQALTQQRDATQTNLNAWVAHRDNLSFQKSVVDAQIVTLTVEIAQLTADIATLGAGMELARNNYFLAQMTMFSVFSPLTLYIHSMEVMAALSDVGRDIGISRVFEDIALRMRGVADRVLERFENLPYLARVAVANSAIRASITLGLVLGGEALRFPLGIALASQFSLFSQLNIPNHLLSLVLETSINAFERGLLRGDLGSMLLLDNLAEALVTTRALENVIANDPHLNFFDKMALLNKLREADNALQNAMMFGLPLDADRYINMLAISMISPFHLSNGVPGLVLDAALKLFDGNPFNDYQAARILNAATGLVSGLSDVLMTLATLDALDALDPMAANLVDGLRLRLAI